MILDTRLLHIFGKLLREAVGRVDWDLSLALNQKAAEPAQPDPPTPGTSTSDELGDMVMDAIEHGGAAAPTTTPVPAPPR